MFSNPQAGLGTAALSFTILSFFALFDSISAGSTCSFTWNNTFYLLGSNSPTSSFTSFSVLAPPVNVTKPSWSLHSNFTAVPLAATFPCFLMPSGMLLLAPTSTSSFISYDLASDTYNAALQMANAPDKDLFSLTTALNASRIVAPVYDSIYVFGAMEDVEDFWVLNVTTRTWAQGNYTNPSTKAPSVNAPGLAFVGGKVVVAGGIDEDGRTDKVWTYDLTNKVWALETEALPSPKSNIIVVPSGANKIFAFGGLDDSGPVQDTSSLDFSVSPHSFASIDDSASTLKPSAIFNSSTATLSDALIVYGGSNNANNLYIFNLTTASWSGVLNLPSSSGRPSNTVTSIQPSNIGTSNTGNPDQSSDLSSDWSPDTPLVIGLGGSLAFFVFMAILMLAWEGFRRHRKSVQDCRSKSAAAPIQLRAVRPSSLSQSRPQSQISRNHSFSRISSDSFRDKSPRYSKEIPEAHLASHSRVSWSSPDMVVPGLPSGRKSAEINSDIPAVKKRHSGSSYKRFSTASFLIRRIRERNEQEEDEENKRAEENDEGEDSEEVEEGEEH